MPIQLFDASDSVDDDISQIKVNEEYARRLEHNKKREDLQRLDELKKKGLISSSTTSEGNEDSESESSDDDENLIGSSRGDREFFNALIKVKKRDPSLKQKDVKLFESDHSTEEKSNEEENGNLKDKGKKAMYLKDVVAKQLIEEGPDFVDEEEEINGKGTVKSDKKKGKKAMHFIEGGADFVVKEGMKTYDEEQKELKRAFLEEAKREGLEDAEWEFFTVKEKAGEGREDSDDGECVKKLDEYFGGDVELNDGSKFLRSYFMNKMWIDKKGENLNVGEEELQDISEDEKEIERQEEYEHRFQENQGDRVLGHARKVEGSVRKNANSRKEQRKSKEERMAIAQKEREEELKHLKNLKKQEILEKMKKIKKTAGLHDDDIIPLTPAEIEEEFDPEEYDIMMKKAFDEKYYDAEDADSEFGSDSDAEMEKPDFEKEDELLGLPKGWDVSGYDDGFIAARERALKQKVEGGCELSDQDPQREEENEEKLLDEGKRKRKRKTALLEKARQAMMDEYYKLDYEDTIGDLKTRFKYARTRPSRYGLSSEELLIMDEKELNQYISLKRLAPYREEEWKLNNQKRHQLKMRTRELLHEVRHHKKKKDKKSRGDVGKSILSNSEVENGKARIEQSNGDMDNLSRKARRKKRLADRKLSHSRLIAYGKIPSNSQGRAKH